MKQRIVLISSFPMGVAVVLLLECGRGSHFIQPSIADEPRLNTHTSGTIIKSRPANAPNARSLNPSELANGGKLVETNQVICDNTDFARPAFSIEAPFAPAEMDFDSLAPLTPSEDEAARLTELRQLFGSLAITKAELLSEKSLEIEVVQLQREIANLRSAQKLHDVQRLLRELIDEFPDSPAADRAKMMLQPQPTQRPVGQPLRPNPDPIFQRQS